MRYMRRKIHPKIALLLIVVVLACTVGPGVMWANEPPERIYYLFDKIHQFNAAGIYSDSEVSCVLVDLSQISTTGSVSAYTYENTVSPIERNFTARTMTLNTAISNMTRYILGDIRTAYLDPPFNCSIAMSVYGGLSTSVPVYVYGDGKSYCIDEIEQALPNIFEINYIPGGGDGGGSGSVATTVPVPDKPITLPVAEQVISAMFSVSSTTLTVSNGDTTNEPTTIEMDVAPEVVNDRTYVPVRYLAYALGVPESGIQWDGTTETVTITNGDTIVSLTINSTTQTVNGEPIEMDVAPYIKEIDAGGRTMLPARWVAEPLGATVTWDQEKQQMMIELPQPQETQEQGQQ